MCGLAGFARHPKGQWLKEANGIFNDLMIEMEERGRHATGIAQITRTGGKLLKKWARPVSEMIELEAWRRATTVDAEVTHVIGHTRHATLPNADDPKAAHPFEFGRTIGAHNGIIRNWKQIASHEGQSDWRVDSQAAIYLIEQEGTDAFKKLVGDWSITAVKDRTLHVARNDGRPMCLAYHPEMRTLFWCSTMPAMKKVLTNWQCLDDFEVWTTNPYEVYSFDVTKFNGSTNRVVTRLPQPKRSDWWAMSGGDQWAKGSTSEKRRAGYTGWMEARFDELTKENKRLRAEVKAYEEIFKDME